MEIAMEKRDLHLPMEIAIGKQDWQQHHLPMEKRDLHRSKARRMDKPN